MSSCSIPLATNSKGHYRTTTFLNLPSTLAANARLFTFRNTGSNLLIPTRMTMRAVQSSAGTAQSAAISAIRCTGFSVSDTTNTATAAASVMSSRGDMAASPGGAQLLVFNGAVAGMTGGTLTKDTNSLSILPITVTAAANTALWQVEAFDGAAAGAHPLVLANNEGIVVENTFVNTTTYGVSLVIDFAWAEVGSFGQ